MGAIRLFFMVVLICGVVAWAIGQRERIADAAESLAGERPQESSPPAQAAAESDGIAVQSGAETRAQVRVPDQNAGPVAQIPAQAPAQAPASPPQTARGGAAGGDSGDEVVIVRAGQRSHASADDYAQTRGLTIKASRDGHFYLKVRVNGAEIPFLVDTGASSVMLTKKAAKRARIYPRANDYTMLAQTANGTVRMAPISVRDMRVGSFRTGNVPGAVNQGDSGVSLLGMSFLSRLKRYEVKGDRLVLYW